MTGGRSSVRVKLKVYNAEPGSVGGAGGAFREFCVLEFYHLSDVEEA